MLPSAGARLLLAALLPICSLGLLVCPPAGAWQITEEDEAARACSESRPNIILIIADDFDYEHLGFMGNALAQTPNIDRIAAQGTVFPVAYTQARCRPTLAGLLSGLPPRRTGVFFNMHGERTRELHNERLLPQLLQSAGYATYAQGKMWEGTASEMGFSHGPGWEVERFVRESQDELFAFLREVGERPFFVWYAPLLPHLPHTPPPRLAQRFTASDVPVPSWIDEERKAAFQEAEATSLAMEAWLDEGIGALIEELERLQLLDLTLLVFMVDNGWANGFLSKGTPYEKGLRTPLVFRWPGTVAEGREDQALASYLDVMPTLLDYAELTPPEGLPGLSLRDRLNQDSREAAPQATDRNHLVGAVYAGVASRGNRDHRRDALALYVRTPRYKYIRWLKDIVKGHNHGYLRLKHFMLDFPARTKGDEELYDLESDPYEHHSLAASADQSQRLAALRSEALTWWRGD